MLGRFGNSKYRYGKVTSAFFLREGKFYVNTDHPDAKLADFEIQYTFSLTPLKQYPIEVPEGLTSMYRFSRSAEQQSFNGLFGPSSAVQASYWSDSHVLATCLQPGNTGELA